MSTGCPSSTKERVSRSSGKFHLVHPAVASPTIAAPGDSRVLSPLLRALLPLTKSWLRSRLAPTGVQLLGKAEVKETGQRRAVSPAFYDLPCISWLTGRCLV